MEPMDKKYRVPRTAITERGLKRLLRTAIKAGASEWAKKHNITAQAVSAFMNDKQSSGLQIPEIFGYRPQVIYLPLDEDPICHMNPPRRVTSKPTTKVDHTKDPVEKRGLKSNDRQKTKDRLKAKAQR